MTPTWEEIIEQAMSVAQMGRRYQIPIEELLAAARSGSANIADPVETLSRKLKHFGFRVAVNESGRFVFVERGME